ncbi:acyltransferase [Chloroflexales bacterium ZM16-3]|nr:acyltransferase [Chloroflexales bacterium ZM16-3]
MDNTEKNLTRSDDLTPTAHEIITKIGQILHEELSPLQPRLILIRFMTSLIPRYAGTRLRAHILRAAGIQIGHGSILMGTPLLYGEGKIIRQLHIGGYTVINIGCVFDLSGPIMIGDHVAIGHEVMFLTSSHQIDKAIHRAGPLFTAPITIEDGAWIGARSVVMPGITIGAGSIVGAGAIVTKDVPPNTMVGGVPARVIRTITDS